MSANTDPTKGCVGKQRFDSFSRANEIARKTASRRPGKFSAYHCPHCAGFHYGRTVVKRQRVNARPVDTWTLEEA